MQQHAFAQYPVAQQGGRGIQQDNVKQVTRYFSAEPSRKPADRTIDRAGIRYQSIVDKHGNVHVAGGTGCALHLAPEQVGQPYFRQRSESPGQQVGKVRGQGVVHGPIDCVNRAKFNTGMRRARACRPGAVKTSR